ncbi:MAG: glycosyltransferase family 39 protein [Candidatus Limnocylindrales bacterium]
MIRVDGSRRVVVPDRWAWPIAFGALVLLAAVLRLDGLAGRGTWDADQGHDLLVLTGFVQNGVWPLLGPPTSIGDFHHGALYYYLLAPAAWLGGGDPAIVVLEIAVLGTAAVGLVAGLARMVGGTAAGIVAGGLMAVSATAIDESTFIWNPNLVAFTSALAVTAAWRAWSTRRARWWLLVALAEAATMQCHVLGAVLLPPLVAWLVADLRRRSGRDRTVLARAAAGAIVLMALTYVPLAVSELQSGFHETRAALAFLEGGGQATAAGPLVRLVFVSLRILAWPLTGLLTDALAVGIVAAIVVITIAVWRSRVAAEDERSLVRWIGATLLWSCLVLGLTISGLASVTPLPVDHYHAFLDPLVFVVVGLGAAAMWRRRPVDAEEIVTRRRAAVALGVQSTVERAGKLVAVALVMALAAWNVAHWPPGVAPDGGYPAAETAAGRIAASTGTRPTFIASLPTFKTSEAYLFPLRRIGATVTDRVPVGGPAGPIVVVCDSLFVPDCGGPAERALLATITSPTTYGAPRLADRFVAAPGRTISVYLPGSGR